jgi:hypothetical protein
VPDTALRVSDAAAVVTVRPPRRARLLVALACGLLAGLATAWSFRSAPQWGAHDFSYSWYGAVTLLDGRSPYEAMSRPVPGVLPFDPGFRYPLPAAVIVAPLAGLDARTAGVLFMGLSVMWLAYGLSRDGWWRLMALASGPALAAVKSAQWSPFVVAAALTSGAGWLMVAKPNLAIPLFLWRPKLSTAVGAVAACALCLVIQPGWPREWAQAMARGGGGYRAPMFTLVGAVLVLAAIRWRTAEGRLLFAIAVLPVNPWGYDALPLALVARTARQMAIWSAASLASWLVFYSFASGLMTNANLAALSRVVAVFTVVGAYLPALGLVLWQARQSDPDPHIIRHD